MPRLFFGNFDFEHSLGNRPQQQLSQKLQAINAIWTPSLIALMKPGDFLWIPQKLKEGDPENDWQSLLQQASAIGISSPEEIPENLAIEFIPWGWTEPLIAWAKKQGWSVLHPHIKIINWANSRATSFDFEKKWGSLPEKAMQIDSIDDLQKSISSFSAEQKWVLKAEFSMSARERIFGFGQSASDITCNWLQKRLQFSNQFFLEPWLDKINEMSFHFEIFLNQQVKFLGMTELFSDNFGRYLKNRTVEHVENSNWEISRIQTNQLAQEYAKKGYFGPLSIDAMRYRDPTGAIQERPLQDINARHSMGRCQWERDYIA